MQKVYNWGKYPTIKSEVISFENTNQLYNELDISGNIISYGNGRSYGDASLQKKILATNKFNSLKKFNPITGILTCESGILLDDILSVFVPKGWFLPVSPGTKFISIGGAIASDIHGKNHHRDGSFGNYIIEMDVMCSDGSLITCSRSENIDFFNLTIGGMGLTGLILNAKIQLHKIETSFITQETKSLNNLDEIMDEFESQHDSKYSVAWIDTFAKKNQLGRGIFLKGRHTKKEELVDVNHINNHLITHNTSLLSIPFDLPYNFLNKFSGKLFNQIYYKLYESKISSRIIHYNEFFYPLDKLKHWNRIYGSNGFTQYQLVLPKETNRSVFKDIIKSIQDADASSYLAVLKLFGDQESFISFPMAGYTLSLDFPVNTSIFSLLDKLDQIVIRHGGRLYLAKDARMKRDVFFKTYCNAHDFREAISLLNNGSSYYSSLLSNRLGIT